MPTGPAAGDGDGRFAAALLRAAPDLRAHAVDGSGAMLALLRRRCKRDGTLSRLSARRGSVLEARATPPTDLIATHFVFDCLTQPQVDHLTHKLAGEAQPGCLWVISDFGYPRGRLPRLLGAVYLRLLYAAFRVLTGLRPQHLPDPQASLQAAGWRRLKRRERLRGLLYAELWEAHGSIQTLAIANAASEPFAHPTQLATGHTHQPKGER